MIEREAKTNPAETSDDRMRVHDLTGMINDHIKENRNLVSELRTQLDPVLYPMRVSAESKEDESEESPSLIDQLRTLREDLIDSNDVLREMLRQLAL